MLLISKTQRQEIGMPAFVDRLVVHFQRYHLEAICELSDDLLRKRLSHCVDKGRERGLTWEYSLTVFSAHMMRIHPEFFEQPDIRRELANESLGEPDKRIDALPARVRREAWEQAAGRGDPEDYWRTVGLGMAPSVEVER